jgi:hypothetical protein
MSNLPNNPLAKHFRQPQIYIKLPSNGAWYPEGAVELPVTGEIPVYAMTARDEITMRTPDALLNGSSTVSVVESCCPNIKDAWKMPSVDIDPILIAIRLATYGNQMDFTTVCPHCGTKNEKAVDLGVILGKVKLANWDRPFKQDDLEFMIKPQFYEDYNKNNLMNFEEQKLLAMVQDEELSEEDRLKQFNVLFERLIDSGLAQVSKSIAHIKLKDGTTVDSPAYIKEFLENCDRNIWEGIKNHLEMLRTDNGGYDKIDLQCDNPECLKEFVAPFVFEQTNFFG